MALDGARAGPFVIVHRPAVDSTSDEARRLLVSGAVPPFVVTADVQTAGRGRRGRVWHSEPGNLFASFVVRPGRAAADWPQASFAGALAVADTVVGVLNGTAALTLKWPNDVLLGTEKVAGILLESADGQGGAAPALIIGIGINLRSGPPAPVVATCLADHGGVAQVAEVLVLLGRHLGRHISVWEQDGFAPVRVAWLKRAHAAGEPMNVRLTGETVQGSFADLDNTGALVLDQNGTRRRIMAGDVALLAART
ncbi:MAG: biotin--[acetyl-CoA-carboxylase] ligase [Proteobacteria bacterium]|nr:biotin--[acetyl-CoA-carboxylase] ligase [Pseudomonadota bacterium]